MNKSVGKSVLCKGLNFSVKPKSIDHPIILLPFELLVWDVKQAKMCSEDLSIMKTRLLEVALSWCESFSSDWSLSGNKKPEFKALKHLQR